MLARRRSGMEELLYCPTNQGGRVQLHPRTKYRYTKRSDFSLSSLSPSELLGFQCADSAPVSCICTVPLFCKHKPPRPCPHILRSSSVLYHAVRRSLHPLFRRCNIPTEDTQNKREN
jgi:hypothetical protein